MGTRGPPGVQVTTAVVHQQPIGSRGRVERDCVPLCCPESKFAMIAECSRRYLQLMPKLDQHRRVRDFATQTLTKRLPGEVCQLLTLPRAAGSMPTARVS